MKTISLYTALILLFNIMGVSVLNAQITTYQKTYGGVNFDIGNCLVGMADNGFIIDGQTKSFGDTSGSTYLLKVDVNGDTEWTRCYGGGWLDGGNSIAATGDGYFLTDHTTSYGAGECDSYVFKTDLKGNKLWAHTFGFKLNDAGYQGIETKSGEYIITGLSQPPSDSSGTPFVCKYGPDGTQQWYNFYGNGEGYRILQTPDDNFVIAGISTGLPNGPDNNMVLFKIDGMGNLLWYKTITHDGNSQPYGLINTQDGNLLIAGYTTTSSDAWQAELIKLSPTGDILWQKAYGNSGNDRAYSVVETSNGYIFAGQTVTPNGDLDVLVLKTDNDGNALWQHTYGGAQTDYARWIAPCTDGGFGIVGTTNSYGAGDYDLYLIKIDDVGNAPAAISEVAESKAQFQVFPNPVHGSFTVNASNVPPGTNLNLNLYDITGNNVSQRLPLSGSTNSFSVNAYAPGIYFYTICSTGGDMLDRGKLVVE
jgi:hypothetical protein